MAEKPKQHPTCTLTPEVLKEFVAIVRRGNFRQVARQRLGIPSGTYHTWIAVGKKQIREVAEGKSEEVLLQGRLVVALDEAEGYVHGVMMEDILASDSIQARQWFLERRFGKLYSRNPAAHVDDETGEEVKIDATALLAERVAALLGE